MIRSRALAAAVAVLAAACASRAVSSSPVYVPAGIDHGEWDRLLKTYVDEKGLVAYADWKASQPDHQALRRYLALYAAPARPAAQGSERAAALINAYNALTIAWVLENHPTRSIRATRQPFDGRRHVMSGRQVSLDDIEHATLRKILDYRVHGALVCAALSCPPLSRDAYTADRLETQLDAAMARWLAREDLNRFEPGRAQVSSVFKWFREDFERAGGVVAVLRRHAPRAAQAYLASEVELRHLDYDWTLNDQRRPGSYGWWRRLRDAIAARL